MNLSATKGDHNIYPVLKYFLQKYLFFTGKLFIKINDL